MAENAYYATRKANQLRQFNKYRKMLPRFTYDYLDEKRRVSQPSTAQAYAYDLKVFFDFLLSSYPVLCGGKMTDLPLEFIGSLTYRDINAYQDYLESSDKFSNNVRGINRKMAALRGLYKYCCTHDMLDKDPTAGASHRVDPKRNDVTARLNNDEVQALIEKVRNSDLSLARSASHSRNSRLRDFAIITLLLGTGLRVSELVSLDISHFQFDSNEFVVTRKGGKSMTLYFGENVKQALLDYIENERPDESTDALFLSNRKSRISVSAVGRMVKKYAREVTTKNISVHRLRKTYGSALYAATRDLKMVSEVLGHSSTSITAKHYISQSDELRKTAASVELYNAK